MTKFRWHLGGFLESMNTTVPATSLDDLHEIVASRYPALVAVGALTVAPYSGVDERNGWDTYVVCLDGVAVGFTDGTPDVSVTKP